MRQEWSTDELIAAWTLVDDGRFGLDMGTRLDLAAPMPETTA